MEIIPNWHPIFVHFTIALLTTSAVLYSASLFINNKDFKNQCLNVARWNLWIGTSVTFLTVFTGWLAYNSVAHDEPSHIAMTDHRNWALVTAVSFLMLTGWSVLLFRKSIRFSYTFLTGILIGIALLVSTGWRGGEIVYRYGLGVMSLPQVEITESDGHDHDHGNIPKKEVTNTTSETNQNIKMESAHDHDGHSH